MIVSDIRQKLLIFLNDVGMSQRTLADELDFNYEHLNAVMNGKYDVSNRFYKQVESLFKRYGYSKGLNENQEL